MSLFGQLRRVFSATETIHECRACGSNFDDEVQECPECGSAEIARYEFE